MHKKNTYSIIKNDPLLLPYEPFIRFRQKRIRETEKRLTSGKTALADFASGHEYFGLHFRDHQWIFREWAPNAEKIYFLSNRNDWQEKEEFALAGPDGQGNWELRTDPGSLGHSDLYRLRIYWPGGCGDRIPSYARRVVQDPLTLIFNAQIWHPAHPYEWKNAEPSAEDSLLIYEAHIGMAQEEEKVGTYREFTQKILPRIADAGYTAVQLMAVQEHPYYGSFGYQVSSFFAASSRFGSPYHLKELVDSAHGLGLRVIMDMVHSHAVINEVEGLSRFDGSLYQYFHEGPRGFHTAWNSRCFDYGKVQVLHFLLSNCRFWLDEYRFDGFRFDGVTSMIYLDHGLEKAFTGYEDYFSSNIDEDALSYLALANKLIHSLRPGAVTIAEDVSGMPGLAAPISDGGCGFDYRFAMGVPDYWIRLCKEIPDEHWSVGHLWYELCNRRKEEKTISYAESHDQALVGDQTLIFRLMGTDIYEHMRVEDSNLRVDRGMALHKMIRLITLATAGNAYLNFMGNEFGHPEWIDFPREGNNWSYRFARRQWSLADNPDLKYHYLARFDKDMIRLARRYEIFRHPETDLIREHSEDKVLIFCRAGLILVFNFHPSQSFSDYAFPAAPGEYRLRMDSDAEIYGGHGRLTADQHYFSIPSANPDDPAEMLQIYLPSRTALVLEPVVYR
ncbi:MAG: alpha amylase C-terminal domain-containing protein [Desulfococcaceae bacterium]|jgi:1,4-alpha-glucan branching enzyme|nr:alpha amylase C-terminal domain-containing protein [Desulfococcaceae bacterium]